MPAQRRVTETQMEHLLIYMEAHPQLARGTQMGGSQGKNTSHQLWDELASILNSLGDGSSKMPKEWRQYWSEQKYKVRRKGSKLLKHGRGTGGGPANTKDILSPIEDRILSLIGVQNVLGLESVRVEVNMGLDDTPSIPSTSQEGSILPPPDAYMDLKRTDMETSQQLPGTDSSTHPRPSKRKHVACKDAGDGDPPAEKHQRPLAGPPRWALDLEERRVREVEARRVLEERRLALEESRFEEERAFRRSLLALEEQRLLECRQFQRDLLSVLGRVCDALSSSPSPSSQ